VTLLAKADEKMPDTLASVTLIDAVNKVYGIGVDTKELKKQKNQIGSELKELSNKYSEHKKIDSNMYM
jgi:predicted ATP-grasp superfamily ATP-dependent carboligase